MNTRQSCRVLRVIRDLFLCRTRDVGKRRRRRVQPLRGRVPAVALALVVGVVGACGERAPGATPARQDPRVVDLLAADGPDEENRERLMLYGRLVGSWDVESRWYQNGEVSSTAEGEWHFAWVLGGTCVQDVLFRKGAPPREYGTTLRCYDAANDVWHVTWMQPASREYAHLVGRGSEGRIVQEVLSPTSGEKERWIFLDITADSFVWRGEVSRDGGATWVLQQEMRARRRRVAGEG